MNEQLVEQRIRDVLAQAGLLKEAELVTGDEDLTTTETETSEGAPESVDADDKPDPPPKLINLFEHPDAHPYVLDLALLKKYGPEWLEWESDTLLLQVPIDFRTVTISDLNMSKLQAVKTLHLVDSFWQEWEVFTPVTMALNGVFPDFRVAQVPTVAQCAVAVDIARRIRTEPKWSDEMLAYLEVVHKHDGISCSIEPLDFVEVDMTDHPVDCADVAQKWPLVRRTRKAPTGDTTTDEQLRRLLIVQQALDEDRATLAAQLPLLLT